MKQLICPYTKKLIPNNNAKLYLLKLYKQDKVKNNQIKIDFYRFNYPEIVNKNFLYQKYIIEKEGLPGLKKITGFDYNLIKFIIKYFDIPLRSHKESVLIGAAKSKISNLEKYGVENVSQRPEIKDKKKITSLQNYGVDNIWKTKNYQELRRKAILDKYGMELEEYNSIKSKEIWTNRTEEEKLALYEKSIFKAENKFGQKSSIEIKIAQILDDLNISYERQFKITVKNKRYFYDFKIGKHLIEVNGTYWHADPRKYKENQVIKFPVGDILVKDIWDKDKFKQKLAQKKKYKFLTIWENEINKLNREDISKLIYNFLKNEI